MQNTLTVQEYIPGTTETDVRAYLRTALEQTELLLKLVQTVHTGNHLSLETWQDVFAASRTTVDQISDALAHAQEVFDDHTVPIPGFVQEEETCDEFACLTWR